MSTVIYLLNQDVKVITGKMSGGKIEVADAFYETLPEGLIVNGVIMNQNALEEFLEDLWKRYNLPKKDVHLGVGSASAVSRKLEIPVMSDKKIREYLPREFAQVERAKDPVYTWIVLAKEGRKQTIFASMQERALLKQYIQIFKNLGVRIKSIQPQIISDIQMLHQVSCLWDKTCVVQLLDGMSVMNVVIVNGHFLTFNRSAVLSARGTIGFGVECARIISNQQQFLRTQQVEEPLADVYLAGFSEEDFELVSDSIIQMDDMMQPHLLELEQKDGFTFRRDVPDKAMFLGAIGGLVTEKGKRNLYYQVTHDPEQARRRKELLLHLLPIGMLTVVLSGYAVFQAVMWFQNTDRVNEVYDYMSNPAVQQAVLDYDRLVSENTQLELRTQITDDTWQVVQSYPQFTSRVEDEINRCAEGLAEPYISGFSSEGGTIVMDVYTLDMDAMNKFVKRLEDETDCFESVYYRGFQYDDSAGAWRAQITCYMATPETESPS